MYTGLEERPALEAANRLICRKVPRLEEANTSSQPGQYQVKQSDVRTRNFGPASPLFPSPPPHVQRTWGWIMQESPDVGDHTFLRVWDIASRLVTQDAVRTTCPNFPRGHVCVTYSQISSSEGCQAFRLVETPPTDAPRLRSRLCASGATRIAWNNRQHRIGGFQAPAASLSLHAWPSLTRDATVTFLETGPYFCYGCCKYLTVVFACYSLSRHFSGVQEVHT